VVGDTYTPVAVGGASGNLVVFSIDLGSTSGCTYNAGNGVVTFAGPAGTCIIDANQAGNASYDAATQVHQTVTVSAAIEKVAQAVAFNGLTPSTARVDSTYTPVANGGASGNPVVFSIDPDSTSGCTYNPDSGLVTFSAPAGSCVIDANQAGNTSYSAGGGPGAPDGHGQRSNADRRLHFCGSRCPCDRHQLRPGGRWWRVGQPH
jgi:hypothetical protein